MVQPSTDPSLVRLWQTSRFIPNTVRLLGTRYRPLFLVHARQVQPAGHHGAVADALSFIDFMQSQDRLGLLGAERDALARDARALRRRFKLKRAGAAISADERWKIVQWLSF
jgi:hypothetical protein